MILLNVNTLRAERASSADRAGAGARSKSRNGIYPRGKSATAHFAVRPRGVNAPRAVLALVVVFLLAIPARPTTFAKMTLEQITGVSPLVVRARCQGSIVVSEKAEIWTVTSFAVKEVWKGSAPVVVRVRLLGGRTAQYTSHVEGVPRFHPGEDVVLFLRSMQRGDFTITSWAQGTFRIHRATSDGALQVTQDTAAAAAEFANSGSHESASRDAIRAVPLEEFRRRVTAASSRSAGSP